MSVYYGPAMGLRLLGSLDKAPQWEFDMIGVWTDGRRLYWAFDSGCSCPTPFENFTDLSHFQTGTPMDCIRAIGNWAANSYHEYGDGYGGGVSHEAVVNFKEKIRDWTPDQVEVAA